MKSLTKSYVALFPGQGSQYKRMCQALLAEDSSADGYCRMASDVVGCDLKQIMQNGDIKTMTATSVAQPLVVLASYLLFRKLLASHGAPQLLVGHSLGEVSATLAAGAIDFEACISFVKRRSELMEKIRSERVGFAGVVLDLAPSVVEQLVTHAGQCYISAYNSPKQLMVGGLKADEKALDNLVSAKGGQYVPYRMIPMRADVAYHTAMMQPYASDFENLLNDIAIGNPKIDIYSTVQSKVVTRGEQIKQHLQKQLLMPVLWSQAITHLAQLDIAELIEVGPGDTMSNLVKEHHIQQVVWSQDQKQDRIV